MTGVGPGRDDEVEALIVDRYLESLLARRPGPTEPVPPELAEVARRLTEALPRYHPSFRFEEALAVRLADAAGGRGPAQVVPFMRPGVPDAPDRTGFARPVVIGSVVTSAAISLAGAAYVAWRRSHPSDPMTRAIRALARSRIA